MEIKFKKMHGAGNDFVLLNQKDVETNDYEALSRAMCDRHFGIGADGFMVAASSEKADIKMIFYNADGSIAEMCGNGIRCFSRFVYEEGLVEGEKFDVETLAGIQNITLTLKESRVDTVRVIMGHAERAAAQVPVATERETFDDETVCVGTSEVVLTSMRVGVPHTMVFQQDYTHDTVTTLGPEIEKHPVFPQKTNVNFVEVIDEDHMRVATWERGAGATLACGTGACASFYAAKLKGLVHDSVEVKVPGGKLNISLDSEDRIIMEGNAVCVAKGYYYYNC